MKRLRLLPIALVPAVVLGLAACSGSGSGGATPTPSASASATAITTCPKPGKSSDAITASGAFGGKTAPTVTFDAGLSASSVQATTVVDGTGAKLGDGDYAQVSYSVYQASDAKKLGTVGFDQGNPQVLSVGGTGFGKLLACSNVGDRVVAVGQSSALGFNTGGEIVVLADIVAQTPDQGNRQAAAAGPRAADRHRQGGR